MNKVYSKNPDIVFRTIADECILVPIKNNVGDLDSIYTLNETAARAWMLIDGQRKLSEIRKVLLDEFDVVEKNLDDDLRAFSKDLKSMNLIVEK